MYQTNLKHSDDDELIIWHLGKCNKLPVNFPHFGEYGDDAVNVIWHYNYLFREYLQLRTGGDKDYNEVSYEELASSSKWGPGFEQPNYRTLVLWHYNSNTRMHRANKKNNFKNDSYLFFNVILG